MEQTVTQQNVRDFHNLHFDSIQALRGLAALFVVFQHVRFLNFGAFGVDIFFCISGFMIMFTTQKSTKHFFRKRLIRIVPLYYLMTVATYLMLLLFPAMFEQTQANPVYLLKSLLFLPFDIGYGILQPLLRIGWTVNCEMFFYLLFFLSFRISRRYRGLICGGLLLVLVTVVQIFSGEILAWHTPVGSFFAPVLLFYGAPVMLEFLLGIAAYYLLRWIYAAHCEHPVPAGICWMAALLVPVIFVLLAVTTPHVNILGFRRIFLWGLPALLLLVLSFLAGLQLRMPAFSVKLGNMSYSLYLMHYYPVMFLDRVVFDFSTFSTGAVAGLLVSLVICLLLTWVCWVVVEQKFTGWLRRRLL